MQSGLTTPADPDTPQTPEELDELRVAGMRALYGDLFPLADEIEGRTIEQGAWVRWAEKLWDMHQPAKRRPVAVAKRNRLLRKGIQWIAQSPDGSYQEPPRPKGASRVTNNIIGPALDQRAWLMSEQRPGFRTRPVTQDQDDLRKAEAQQLLVEYEHDEQDMAAILQETAYWTGTDGVAFWMVYWDGDAGPWHQEYQTSQDGSQRFMSSYPMGDARTKVYRIDQVVVSANATATQKPYYWVIKETLPVSEAMAFHGTAAITRRAAQNEVTRSFGWMSDSDSDERLEGQDTVDRYIVFCEPSEYLPEGLMMVAVNGKEMIVTEIPVKCVPMVRVTDGSTDPAFFLTPNMNDWVDHQLRINATLSKWVDTVRLNGGGRFFGKPRALGQETLVGGLHSMVEVRTPGPIGEAVEVIPPFSIGNDAKELIASDMRAFERKSGWSEESAGQMSGETSGRAILASREMLERVFAPPIRAAAKAMTRWAKLTLKWCQWGFDLPRSLGVMGAGRPDLAREISSDDLDGVTDVQVDAETMMPMPYSLKMFVLDQYLEKGAIDITEYRRRSPFALVRNIDTPDEDHYARARRVAEALLVMQPPPPLRWVDNEKIHQDVLERSILLRDDLDPQVIAMAQMRWDELAMLGQYKMGVPGAQLPPSLAQPQQPANLPPSMFAPSPSTQPLLLNSPSVPTNTADVLSGYAGERMAQEFDSTRPF